MRKSFSVMNIIAGGLAIAAIAVIGAGFFFDACSIPGIGRFCGVFSLHPSVTYSPPAVCDQICAGSEGVRCPAEAACTDGVCALPHGICTECGKACETSNDCNVADGFACSSAGRCWSDAVCGAGEFVAAAPDLTGIDSECGGEACNPRDGEEACVYHPRAGWIRWDRSTGDCFGPAPDAGRCGEPCDPALDECVPGTSCDTGQCAAGRTCQPGAGGGSVCWSDACGPSPLGACYAACETADECWAGSPETGGATICHSLDCGGNYQCVVDAAGSSVCMSGGCADSTHTVSGNAYCDACDPDDATGCTGRLECRRLADGYSYCVDDHLLEDLNPDACIRTGLPQIPDTRICGDGICSSPAETVNNCNVDCAVPSLPTPTAPASGALCADQGGIANVSEVCTCQGVILRATFCGNGARIDTFTDTSCEPNPADCQAPVEPTVCTCNFVCDVADPNKPEQCMQGHYADCNGVVCTP